MLGADQLVQKVQSYQPSADADLIRRAYHYSEWAHREQSRKSGDPYFIHPVSVAEIITDLKLDTASVVAGLLHDVVEDTPSTLVDITRDFGQEVATLVDGAMSAGSHTVSFDASGLSSGLYFYTLEANGHAQTRKMVLSK